MYLVNSRTLTLEDFTGKTVPPYAILSHRWGEEELTFKEVNKQRPDKQKDGYIKMAAACSLALNEYQVEYLWVDTCCIDKKNSAELTEAINSMYRWYQDSAICIAYLSDVQQGASPPVRNKYGEVVMFENSKWFSRAWTLQELLAPAQVHFYDSEWTSLGTKDSLTQVVNAATGIPQQALTGEKTMKDFSIAQKMHWAASRNATREEDIAYSLLGIFDVNMPLLYGEGKKSFIRLQEEIIRRTSDHTFLFWGLNFESNNLLANHPAQFASYGSDGHTYEFAHKAMILSNIGIEMELKLRFWDWDTYCIEYHRSGANYGRRKFVVLFRLDRHTGYLYRIGHIAMDDPANQGFLHYGLDWEPRKVTILREPLHKDPFAAHKFEAFCGVRIDNDSLQVVPVESEFRFGQLQNWQTDLSSKCLQCRFEPPSVQTVAQMTCLLDPTHQLLIALCFDFDFVVYVYIVRQRKEMAEDDFPTIPDLKVLRLRNRKDLKWREGGLLRIDYAYTKDVEDANFNASEVLFRHREEASSLINISKIMELKGKGDIHLSLFPPLSSRLKGRNQCWILCLDQGLDKLRMRYN